MADKLSDASFATSREGQWRKQENRRLITALDVV